MYSKKENTRLFKGKKLSKANSGLSHPHDFNARKTASGISLIYIIIGLIWISFSDRILHIKTASKDTMAIISLLKGWFYVFITGILLFLLILRSLNRLHLANQALGESYEKLLATESKLQEKVNRLTETEERFRLISDNIYGGIWDEVKGIRSYSDKWYKMTGYSKEDLEVGAGWMNLIHPDDIEDVEKTLQWHKDNRYPNYECIYRLRFKNEEYRWILSKAHIRFDKDGQVVRMIGSHTDINDLKDADERLRDLAYKDTMTGLPNRESFYKDVSESIQEQPDTQKALIFLDIDSLKQINDVLEHRTGDKIIKAVGDRLQSIMGDRQYSYRSSGDEFIVFIPEYDNINKIVAMADKIVEHMGLPFDIDDNSLNISASIGISLYPFDGKDIDTFFKSADMAMQKSKQDNRGGYTFYHVDMIKDLEENLLIGHELRGALSRKELKLHYQPLIELKTGKIRKFEALLRWENEKLGNVPPTKFIHVAEELQLINSIGDWVIESACIFLRDLHNHGFFDISISINVSIVQLMQQDFYHNLVETLDRHNIDPRYFEIEITESILMESYDIVSIKLLRLLSKGISIALDDFGTGYSSLSYLTRMPINTIKIDKSFINPIGLKKVESSLVKMIIELGYQLGVSIVAEGVETQEQYDFLKRYKCHMIQGHYFSKSISENQALDLLKNNNIYYSEIN